MPQTLRRRLRERGTLRLIPRIFALMAVQRQRAASRSTSPSIREQQGFFGGFPSTTPSKFPRTLAQTPNFSVSIGHLPFELGLGVGFGFGFGFGLGLGQVPHALTRVKKRRFTRTKRAREVVLLEAIVFSNFRSLK